MIPTYLKKIAKLSAQNKTQTKTEEMHNRKNLNLFHFSHRNTSQALEGTLKYNHL